MRYPIKKYMEKGDKEITKNQLVSGMMLVFVLALSLQRVLDNSLYLLGRQPEFGRPHLIIFLAITIIVLYLLYKLRTTFSWIK